MKYLLKSQLPHWLFDPYKKNRVLMAYIPK